MTHVSKALYTANDFSAKCVRPSIALIMEAVLRVKDIEAVACRLRVEPLDRFPELLGLHTAICDSRTASRCAHPDLKISHLVAVGKYVFAVLSSVDDVDKLLFDEADQYRGKLRSNWPEMPD